MATETWHVGAEYDQSAFKRLGDALRSLGYAEGTHNLGVGGSQELSAWTVRGPTGDLEILSETYMGLQVSGSAVLVRELQAAYKNASAR